MTDNYGCPICEGSTGGSSACPIHGQQFIEIPVTMYHRPPTPQSSDDAERIAELYCVLEVEKAAREKAETELSASSERVAMLERHQIIANAELCESRYSVATIAKAHQTRLDEVEAELAALRSENERLKGERDEWHRKANGALQDSIDAERARDELAAAQAEINSIAATTSLLPRERRTRCEQAFIDACGKTVEQVEAILDAHDEALIQKYKDRMIHAGWPLAVTALFSDDPAELLLCRTEVDQSLAALVGPLANTLRSVQAALGFAIAGPPRVFDFAKYFTMIEVALAAYKERMP